MTLAHAIQGLKAKNEGARFEKLFEAACLSRSIACTRFPDGCRQVGAYKLVRIKTPWDWVLSMNGRAAFIDTKSCNDNSFPHSHIEAHQIDAMLMHEAAGNFAGYVIWFRKPDLVIFMPASQLKPRIGERGSVRPDEKFLINLGPVATHDPRRIFAARGMTDWMTKEIEINGDPRN